MGDKKCKPVVHVAATTGSGDICHLTPDELNLKLAEMLKETIEFLCPNESLRSNITLYLDRGYLQLAEAQGVDISNLIQIMVFLHVYRANTILQFKLDPTHRVV